jgi:hypothetical protein
MPHIVEMGFIDSEQPEEPSHRSSSFETVTYPGQPDGQINTGSSEQPQTQTLRVQQLHPGKLSKSWLASRLLIPWQSGCL